MRILVVALFLFFIPKQLSSVCGIPLEFYGYQFMMPESAQLDDRFIPYIGGFEQLYKQLQPISQEETQQQDNIDEWYERYCENVKKKDLVQLIYGNSENRLMQLKSTLAKAGSRLSDLPPNLRNNSFARYLMKHRCLEVVEYLLYAKKVEPYVVAPRNSFAKAPPKGNAMKTLVQEGLNIFPTVKSHYIRLRYAYQLMRLSHYRGDYEHVVELYEYLMPKIDADPSLIYYWIDGHYAGALQFLGERVKAAYLFSRIFIKCPSKRSSAYRSFSIKTDEEWQELLNHCNSDRERADLYVLRAQNHRAQLIEEMKQVYDLDPNNKGLEMLLVREIKLLEKDFLAYEFNPQKRKNRALGIPRKDARDRLINLQDFVLSVIKDNRSDRLAFWKLSSGYLHLLAGDFHYAKRTFWTIAPELKNDTLKQQLNIFQRVLDIMSIKSLNDSLEHVYFSVLRKDKLLERHPDLDNLIYDKFRKTYKDDKEMGKAFLLTHKLDDLRYNLDIGLLEEFYTLAADTNNNSFEKRLLVDRSGPNGMYDMIDMEATYYLQRGQIKLANKLFQQIPIKHHDDYGNFSPFIPLFKDRVNFRLSDTSRMYNKAELYQKIIDMENDAALSTDNEVAARKYFTIGLAYYNMSYFGYSWKAGDYYRSSTSAARAAKGEGKSFVFSSRAFSGGNYENMSMGQARHYFELSRRKTSNLEWGARAAYWAAKTERNEYYAHGKPGGQRQFGYFGLLTDHYSDTKYYQKIIEECRTFAWFVGK